MGLAENIDGHREEQTCVIDKVEESDDVGQEESQEVQTENQQYQCTFPVESELRQVHLTVLALIVFTPCAYSVT